MRDTRADDTVLSGSEIHCKTTSRFGQSLQEVIYTTHFGQQLTSNGFSDVCLITLWGTLLKYCHPVHYKTSQYDNADWDTFLLDHFQVHSALLSRFFLTAAAKLDTAARKTVPIVFPSLSLAALNYCSSLDVIHQFHITITTCTILPPSVRKLYSVI